MALTRRTQRFRELAEAIDLECRSRSATIPAREIDEALNARVEQVGHLMRIGPRAALAYAPDELAAQLAAQLIDRHNQTRHSNLVDLRERRSRRHAP